MNTHTVVAGIHHEVVNTNAVVSDVHQGVVNTHAIVSDIHRTIVRGQEGAGSNNLPVSAACTLLLTASTLTHSDSNQVSDLGPDAGGSNISYLYLAYLANPRHRRRGLVLDATN